jgi:hypothetical protein
MVTDAVSGAYLLATTRRSPASTTIERTERVVNRARGSPSGHPVDGASRLVSLHDPTPVR